MFKICFRLFIFWLIAALTLETQSANAAVKITPLYNSGEQVSLSGIWKFKYIPSLSVGSDSLFYLKEFDVSGWSDINVPGHWELQGFSTPRYSNPEEGTGLYRTTFRLDPSFGNGRIFLRFEGVLFAYDVYINGIHAGKWASAFNAASFEITGLIDRHSVNVIAVKVSTRSKEYHFDTSDCWALSGIFRDVYIFRTPDIYLDDFTVRTYVPHGNNSVVSCNFRLGGLDCGLTGAYKLKASLHSPDGKMVSEKAVNADSSSKSLDFEVTDPLLWTAETPYLYKLGIQLIREGKVIQEASQFIGIRQISIEEGILKLNGIGFKLRGINHHDLVPETGRTLSKEQILKDLLLMKNANINFIRTSHYPPDRRMLDYCDSIGFYVMCEIPFNYGSGPLLRDPSSTDILLSRAEATLLRDMNHPSIIIWSLGNENPITPYTEITGKYVKQTDPTRPVCYPMRGDYFNANYHSFPDFIDIWSPHYEKAAWLKDFAAETTKPVILTEYAHALGLSFGNMGDTWTEMFRNNKIAGGAVWHFQDQGILRRADQPVDKNKPTYYAWPDSVHYYDTNTIDGVDGIVYADRTPQADYWQVRKIYSPVQVIVSPDSGQSDSRRLKFHVINQYDFTNLNTLSGLWKRVRNGKTIRTGELKISCAPHDTATVELDIGPAIAEEENVEYIQLQFRDNNKLPIYEHTISLTTDCQMQRVRERICSNLEKGKLKLKIKPEFTRIEAGQNIFSIDKSDLGIKMDVKESKDTFFIGRGIFARIGRTPGITDISIRNMHVAGLGEYFHDPWLLVADEVRNVKEEKTKDKYRFSASGVFPAAENEPAEKINGKVYYTIKNNGELTVRYDLIPEQFSGIFLEAGISFILSPEIDNFFWLGDGPFASYPDKFQLDEFGIHSLNKNDLHFNGNRSNVEIAVLTDNAGNGMAFLCKKGNLSVELCSHQIVVSHNSLVSGMSNKKTIPSYLVRAGDTKKINGEFRIFILRAGLWPAMLKEILDLRDQIKIPFKPFYYSYDQSE